MREPRPDPITSPPAQKTATSIADGRYLLVQKIAEGGTAVVYKAYDTVDQQWRAIKTLLPDYAKRPALRNRFEREAKTMQQLHHPNIIQVYDAGGDNETAYLVMEYADGGSVIDWVERHGRPMPPQMATQVALELCAGIHYAHEEGVIHRDIKPQNLLVDRYGVCKVTDFGIAQVVANEVRMTIPERSWAPSGTCRPSSTRARNTPTSGPTCIPSRQRCTRSYTARPRPTCSWRGP